MTTSKRFPIDQKTNQPLAAPILLTPDQIKAIAAGMVGSGGKSATTGHVPPPPRLVAM